MKQENHSKGIMMANVALLWELPMIDLLPGV